MDTGRMEMQSRCLDGPPESVGIVYSMLRNVNEFLGCVQLSHMLGTERMTDSMSSS